MWSGHCDDIPAAADAATLDELLAKISAMALDLVPGNHPDVDPASLFLQITALREAGPAEVRVAPQFDKSLLPRSKKDVDGRVKPGHDG